MRNNFSPSINILRDQDLDFKYIPTPNAERIISQINEFIFSGIKSFYLVGSYGTGKSSFLWALEKQIEKSKKIFKTPISFNGTTNYEIINIVGDYISLETSIRSTVGFNPKNDFFEELKKYYNKLHSLKKGLLIVIDEFGKFLEFASQNSPEKELYFIQKIAEFSNDHRRNVILITSLHQGFDAYRNKFDEKSKNEWDKVKGRLKEIAFNEPVEQLLYLASEYIKEITSPIDKKDFKELYKSIIHSKVYPLGNSLNENLAQQLYPLDLLAAGILTKALQRYGQNERSLFTFLETNDLKKFSSTKRKYFDLSLVFDYLVNNFYSLLSSKYNPDYLKWSVIRTTLERTEILFENESQQKEKLIKVIGLLNIFAPHGAKINSNFLIKYGNYALGIGDVEKQLRILESKKIIRYQTYSNTYVLFEGTDLDIDLALNEAENYINFKSNVAHRLKEYFDFPYLSAKANYIQKGTPRFFEFILTEGFEKKIPEKEIDGFIYLVFNKSVKINDVIEKSKSSNEAILYGIFENTEKIEDTIKEIDKVNYVLENNIEDRVVQRELKGLRESLIKELNKLVIELLFEKNSEIKWVFNGKEYSISTRRELNKLLSFIVNKIYPSTPIFLNDLINREKLPSTITIARKELFKRILDNWNQDDLGIDSDKYPPEKTIYLSLLKSTGIHRIENSEFILGEPNDESFFDLWKACEKYFNSCKTTKKNLNELVELLSKKPFKLKQGFIDFWLPIYLIIRRDDYALFDRDIYIPYLNVDLFDLIIRYPQNYYIKVFDIQGIKFDLFNRYRNLINKSKEEKITQNSFIDTIKPFLIFYRNLPEYTKKTKRLSIEALSFRDAIANAKDPEKAFFEDFPAALGFSSVKLYESEKQLEIYTQKLQNCIREIRTCFEELILRIEDYIFTLLGISSIKFPDYRNILIKRYISIKKYLLLPHQKSFYLRINSELDDKKAWLGSIVHSLINKNLELIDDEDEEIIFEKLSTILKEFDNLCEFANLQINEDQEEAIRIEIASLNEETVKQVIRVPKQKQKLIKELGNEISKVLKGDRSIQQLVLLKLLKERLNNE